MPERKGPAQPDGQAATSASAAAAYQEPRQASFFQRHRRGLELGGAAFGIFTTIALAESACGTHTVGEGAQPGSTTTPSATSTPDGKPIPSPAPQPDACSVVVNNQETCTVGGLEMHVPVIPGVETRIVSGHVEFFATADNPYGLKAGEYAGQYVQGVTEGETQTGGLVFTEPVVNKLMQGKPGSTIVLPTDISGLTNVSLNIDPSSDVITIDTHGQSVQVRNIVQGSNSFDVLNSIFTSQDPQNQGLFTDYITTHSNGIDAGHESQYISVYSDAGLTHHQHYTFAFGQDYGSSHGKNVYVSYGVNPSKDGANLQNQILNVNGVPVFMGGTPTA